jgi:hypothetical protein
MLGIALWTVLMAIPPSPAGPADRVAIEETIGHYFRAGDTSSSQELRLAFHPATMMFFVKDGALTGVSQPEWWERTDANKTPVVAASRKIPLIDVTGDAAVAKILSDYPTHRFTDYMSLIRIDGRWWIVGKIFHRTVPHDAAAPSPAAAETDRTAIRATLQTFHTALESGDVEAAAGVTEPRAMAYTLLEGKLIGVSAAEAQARLAARKAAGDGPKATHRIAWIDADTDAGVARLEHDLPTGTRIDYASLLKLGGQWKIVGLVSGNTAAPNK